MSLFHINYNCHPGAIVMRKSDGAIYHVRGNVGLWNMTAILEPWDVENNKPLFTLDDEVNGAVISVNPKGFAEQFLILDEGVDHLSEALKVALSQIVSGKI